MTKVPAPLRWESLCGASSAEMPPHLSSGKGDADGSAGAGPGAGGGEGTAMHGEGGRQLGNGQPGDDEGKRGAVPCQEGLLMAKVNLASGSRRSDHVPGPGPVQDMGYAIGNWMVKVPVMPFWAWPGTGHR